MNDLAPGTTFKPVISDPAVDPSKYDHATLDFIVWNESCSAPEDCIMICWNHVKSVDMDLLQHSFESNSLLPFHWITSNKSFPNTEMPSRIIGAKKNLKTQEHGFICSQDFFNSIQYESIHAIVCNN